MSVPATAPPSRETAAPAAPHVILFDGQCGVCNRFNRLVIDRDRRGRFVFAPLQSDTARELLEPHGHTPDDLSTMYVIAREAGRERVLARSDASAFVFARLDGPLRVLGWLRFVPRVLRDLGYRLFARHRYRLLGRREACPLPQPGDLERFLER